MMVGMMERDSISEQAMEGTVRGMSYGQYVAARYYPVEIVQLLPDGGKIVRCAPMPPAVKTREAVIAKGRRRSVDGPVRSAKPKKVRTCVVCGGELRPNQRKYCSDDCSRKAHGGGEEKRCVVCGEPLGMGQMRYCGWDCRYKAQRERQKANPRYIPIDLPDRPCKVCGKMMLRPSRSQSYCGPECREQERRKLERKWRENNRPEWKPRICAICGLEIEGKGLKYCTSCASAESARRSRERSARKYAERKAAKG